MLDSLRFIVLLLWPLTGWATGVTLGTTLIEVPLLAWAMVTILSLVSGLAALLTRWRELEPQNPWLFASSHMLGSIVAGFVTFLFAEQSNMPDFPEAALIAISAHAGARLIDALASRLVAKAAT